VISRVLTEAQRLVAAGVSLIPIAADGSKRPVVSWKAFQSRRPTAGELQRWFASAPYGLAIVGGYVSGCLEVLDFDATDIFDPWRAMVEELAPGLLERLPLTQTPSAGRHVPYRCAIVEGNQKLARGLNAEGRPETLIETRGAGGYAIIPPSPPTCHPLKKPYVLLRGDLAAIPMITAEERTIVLSAARSFNEHVESKRVISGTISPGTFQPQGSRPGEFCHAQAQWSDILEPHGWSRVGQRGEITLWKRPGKRARGWTATTNYNGSNLLYVFSSNALPFEPERAYSKFAAYALLAHGGDWRTAADAWHRRRVDGRGSRPVGAHRLGPLTRPAQTRVIDIPSRPRSAPLEGMR
jgi:Bifunctional DNA primase/polymerase, N-terminal